MFKPIIGSTECFIELCNLFVDYLNGTDLGVAHSKYRLSAHFFSEATDVLANVQNIPELRKHLEYNSAFSIRECTVVQDESTRTTLRLNVESLPIIFGLQFSVVNMGDGFVCVIKCDSLITE